MNAHGFTPLLIGVKLVFVHEARLSNPFLGKPWIYKPNQQYHHHPLCRITVGTSFGSREGELTMTSAGTNRIILNLGVVTSFARTAPVRSALWNHKDIGWKRFCLCGSCNVA